jgi:hypothetical protein
MVFVAYRESIIPVSQVSRRCLCFERGTSAGEGRMAGLKVSVMEVKDTVLAEKDTVPAEKVSVLAEKVSVPVK